MDTELLEYEWGTLTPFEHQVAASIHEELPDGFIQFDQLAWIIHEFNNKLIDGSNTDALKYLFGVINKRQEYHTQRILELKAKEKH